MNKTFISLLIVLSFVSAFNNKFLEKLSENKNSGKFKEIVQKLIDERKQNKENLSDDIKKFASKNNYNPEELLKLVNQMKDIHNQNLDNNSSVSVQFEISVEGQHPQLGQEINLNPQQPQTLVLPSVLPFYEPEQQKLSEEQIQIMRQRYHELKAQGVSHEEKKKLMEEYAISNGIDIEKWRQHVQQYLQQRFGGSNSSHGSFSPPVIQSEQQQVLSEEQIQLMRKKCQELRSQGVSHEEKKKLMEEYAIANGIDVEKWRQHVKQFFQQRGGFGGQKPEQGQSSLPFVKVEKQQELKEEQIQLMIQNWKQLKAQGVCFEERVKLQEKFAIENGIDVEKWRQHVKQFFQQHGGFGGQKPEQTQSSLPYVKIEQQSELSEEQIQLMRQNWKQLKVQGVPFEDRVKHQEKFAIENGIDVEKWRQHVKQFFQSHGFIGQKPEHGQISLPVVQQEQQQLLTEEQVQLMRQKCQELRAQGVSHEEKKKLMEEYAISNGIDVEKWRQHVRQFFQQRGGFGGQKSENVQSFIVIQIENQQSQLSQEQIQLMKQRCQELRAQGVPHEEKKKLMQEYAIANGIDIEQWRQHVRQYFKQNGGFGGQKSENGGVSLPVIQIEQQQSQLSEEQIQLMRQKCQELRAQGVSHEEKVKLMEEYAIANGINVEQWRQHRQRQRQQHFGGEKAERDYYGNREREQKEVKNERSHGRNNDHELVESRMLPREEALLDEDDIFLIKV